MRRIFAPSVILFALATLAGFPGVAGAGPRAAVVVVRDAVASAGGDVVIEGHVVADKGFEVTRPGGVTGRFATLRKVWKNLQLIRGQPVKHATVHLTVDGKSYAVETDRKGQFSLDLGPRSGIRPGRYAIEARLDGGLPYRVLPGRLAVWPEGKGRGRALLSDVDDTILETGANHLFTMLRHTLTTDAGEMQAVPGAARAYRSVARDGVPMVYVSGGVATLYPKVREFLRINGFPDGALVLQKPGIRSFFTDLRRYKFDMVNRVKKSLPGRSMTLVGDSGQKDPEGYSDVRASDADHVSGIFIHRVMSEKPSSARFKGEHVFDHYDAGVARALRAAGRGGSVRDRARAARLRSESGGVRQTRVRALRGRVRAARPVRY